MKKTIFFTLVMIFTMSASMAFAGNTAIDNDGKKPAVPVKKEIKLSEAEISRLTKRVEEIRDMDKSDMSSKEKKELRKEVKEIKKNVKKSGGTIYIGGATLILLIILIVILV